MMVKHINGMIFFIILFLNYYTSSIYKSNHRDTYPYMMVDLSRVNPFFLIDIIVNNNINFII